MSPAPTTPPNLGRLAERFDLSDDDIRDQAEKAAGSVRRLADLWERNGTDDAAVLRSLRAIAKRHAIRMPNKAGLAERINRMCDAGFWRRSLRYRFKAVELTAIQRGAVHAHASPYVSAKALRRHQRHAARMAEQMAALEAINQTTGESVSMPELIAASLANPAHRRSALMARIKGIETSATARGHVGLFLTLTCPSRMHPRLKASGVPNPVYDGRWFPTRAHRYLCQVWGRAMRAAAHQGLNAYGLRVVEPHHDACPHWHMLAFIDAAKADSFVTLMRGYALRDSPNERGAQERRFTVERIDPTKGSAVAYVAKYVSKSIDGHGVDGDSETSQDGNSAARRQIAWARVWNIRQFQFFGVPPITPTREFFRVAGDTLPGEALPALHAVCKANDYAGWLATTEVHGLRLAVEYAERPSTRYRGETTKAVQGVRVEGGDLGGVLQITTRCDTWRIEPRPKTSAASAAGVSASEGLCPPWTRINNSAVLDLEGLFPDALPEGMDVWGDAREAEEVSRTGHRYPVRDEAIGDQPARSVAPPPDGARTSAEGGA
ncbi:MAG: replication endonuclease [Roseateles sp.]|uniref:replication endonuclease n=1 Tax=Roseateles sp. TaxID=1971397 RepID=UPI00403702D6